MPRLRVSVGARNDAAVRHPREFAILHQLEYAGEIDTAALKKYAPKLDEKLAAGGEVEFEAFADAVTAPRQIGGVEGEGDCLAYAARDVSGDLSPLRIERRQLRAQDVHVQIVACGICHSDLHSIRGEWGGSKYPLVPGHEIVGIVVAVGPEVTKFEAGDRVGVGCIVDSCRTCKWCKLGDEPYCSKMVLTYSGVGLDGVITQGGYATSIVVDSAFVLRIPESLPLDAAAPLLCAGITVWTSLKDYGLDKPGTKLAVNGLGGLGHIAVKLAKAMGAEVTVISRSRAKEEAARGLGADHYLVSEDTAAMEAAAGTLEGIIDTVSAVHDVGALLGLLEPRGRLCLVGAAPGKLDIPHMPIIFKHLTFGGSLVGNLKDTQAMLDFCGEKGVACDVEVIPIQKVNEAMDRLHNSDVKFRFVIDITGSLVQ